MTWHIRDSRGAVKAPRKPVNRPSARYFHASQWLTFGQVYLALAIEKLARAESRSTGPTRGLLRSKRLRAVEVFRKRFGDPPIVRAMEHWHPKLRR